MSTIVTETLRQRVAAIRRFNRFYTQRIGVLQKTIYHRPLSLTEARVLYEVAHGEDVTFSKLVSTLGLDPGYVSRILKGFDKRGYLHRNKSADRRSSLLTLTRKGAAEFARINASSNHEVALMIAKLSDADQQRMIAAMDTISNLLGASPNGSPSFLLRPPAAGDMGWVIQRHGAIYAEEYGWNQQFEALVAEIVARFIRKFDADKERCWIAERDGQNVGCVFLIRKSQTIAQLRMLLVEPSARGLGIGDRLVAECIRFARQHRYRKIILWTNDILHAARHIYEKYGFVLVKEEKHHSFGHDLVGQTWELRL